LGWEPRYTIDALIDEMVSADIGEARLEKGA
jgi:hypothetical protein